MNLRCEKSLLQTASINSEVLRVIGFLLDGRSLEEWLALPEVEVAGRATVTGTDCVVVQVPYSRSSDPPSQQRFKRFFIAKSLGYMCIQYESIKDDQLYWRGTATKLEEVVPGVWFPVEGLRDAGGREGHMGKVQNNPFYVTSVAINSGVSDDFFELDFDSGTSVRDSRFDPAIEYQWGRGTAPENFL